MVFSVPSQTYNERGIEGLPQSMSRIHTTWYLPSNSGAANKQPPGESTWQNSLPAEQQTAAVAAKTAKLWMTNKANQMQLPAQLAAADASGDGVIDQQEFRTLMDQAGASGDAQKIFAEVSAESFECLPYEGWILQNIVASLIHIACLPLIRVYHCHMQGRRGWRRCADRR